MNAAALPQQSPEPVSSFNRSDYDTWTNALARQPRDWLSKLPRKERAHLIHAYLMILSLDERAEWALDAVVNMNMKAPGELVRTFIAALHGDHTEFGRVIIEHALANDLPTTSILSRIEDDIDERREQIACEL